MAEVSVEPQMMTTLTVRVVAPALVKQEATSRLGHALTAGEVARDVLSVLLDAGLDATVEILGFNKAAAKVTPS